MENKEGNNGMCKEIGGEKKSKGGVANDKI